MDNPDPVPESISESENIESSQVPAVKQQDKAFVLLDGATATNLYERGMPQGVCVEEWILEHPQIMTELQVEFVNAGSDIIYAPTFSANREKLRFFHRENDVVLLNRQLVALTRSVVEKAERRVRVAGNLSPTGLFVEPFGDSTFDELVEIYSEQATALNDAGVDLFAIETMLSVGEIRAAVFACRKYQKPIFVTVTVNEKGKMLSGASALSALICLQELGVSAFGLNCSFGPEIITQEIAELAPFSRIPLIAKPNAGLPNPLMPSVYELSPVIMRELMQRAVDAGASYIGGCCGTTSEHIAAMREMLDYYSPTVSAYSRPEQENDLMLTNETELFALDNDRLEFSSPIRCEYDMADVLLEAADDSVDVISIYLDTVEEAEQLAQNAHFAKLPICLRSGDADALSRALLLYHGRAMVDKKSSIEKNQLHSIVKEYGAVLY